MATSGALSGFLQAMLQLRAQRLQEEEAKQRASQAGMSSLMGGITSGIGSLMGGFQQAGQNQMYNRLSNQLAPPSATAVDPLMQAKFTGRLGAPATGGKEEYQALMQQQELQDKIASGKMNELYKAAAFNRAEGYYNRSAEQAAAAKQAAELKARNDAWEAMSKQAKEMYSDAEAYLKTAPGLRADMEKALEGDGDPTTFNQKATELMAMNSVRGGRKLGTPLIDVPAYFPKNQQGLLDDYLKAKAAAAGAPATSPVLGGLYSRESPEAQKLRTTRLAAAGQMGPPGTVEDIAPGVSVPYPSGAGKYAPAATVLPTEMVSRAAQGGGAPGSVSPQEFQQIAGQPPPAAAGAAPMPAAAPGVPTTKFRDNKTGKLVDFNYNPQTRTWERVQ